MIKKARQNCDKSTRTNKFLYKYIFKPRDKKQSSTRILNHI